MILKIIIKYTTFGLFKKINFMKLLKSIIIIGFLSIPSLNYAQFTDQINSNRPGESMGAFSVGKKVIQVEGGLYGIKESHEVLNYDAGGFGLDFSVRAGLLKEQLEFILDDQFQLDKFVKEDNKFKITF